MELVMSKIVSKKRVQDQWNYPRFIELPHKFDRNIRHICSFCALSNFHQTLFCNFCGA